MTLEHKGITYQISEGTPITENKTETLDSVPSIFITHQTSPIKFEPYDKVIIHTPLKDYYMDIENSTETLISVKPKIYNYELSLFSQTKELEGIILPNRRITQLRTGTKRTVAYYINQYVSLYGKKIRKPYDDTFGWYSKWSTQLDNKFDVECPEFQWNTPTLREVLTDLMMVVDCIPVLKNNVITYIDLTEKGNNISQSPYINYITKSHSAIDYVSEIRMNLQNVIQSEKNGVNDSVRVVQVFPFTAESGYIITSDNITYRTRYPILKIKHLWFSFWTSCNNGWVFLKKDLCNLRGSNDSKAYNLVKEEKEYSTLSVLNRLSDISRDSDGIVRKAEDFAKYQNLCVKYTRGGNEISNWNSNIKTWWKFTDSFLEVLMKFIVKYCVSSSVQNPSTDSADVNNYFRPLIEVEYETTMNQTFSAGKSIKPSNDRVIIDNQTNSFVDSYAQGNLEYQKVNRLGNQQMMINARYPIDGFRDINPHQNIIKIGDFYEDYVVYQVTYRFYQTMIEINAIACENYIMKDYYTGIKSKVRTWVNAKDEASEMHELVKCYLEFSESQKTDILNNLDVRTDWFLTSIHDNYTDSFKYGAVIRTLNLIPSTGNQSRSAYCISELTKIVGNSIVYTAGFEDNSVFVNSINISSDDFNSVPSSQRNIPAVKADYTTEYGGIPLQPILYTDSNFECSQVTIGFDSGVTDDYARCSDESVFNTYPEAYLWKQVNYSTKSAEYTVCPLQLKNKIISKDNREIPVISVQLEFCSDSKKIGFTKRFLELERCLRDTAISPMLRILEGSTNSFNWKNPSSLGAIRNNSASYTISSLQRDDGSAYNKSYLITLNNVTPNKAYYICDSNNNVLLATNNLTSFYLNVLQSRDNNIYDDDDNIVDSIINQ